MTQKGAMQVERMEQAKPRFEALTVPKPSEYDGVMCPCCNYEHTMEAGTPEVNDDEVCRETKCNWCGATWTEVYGLIGYASLRDEEGEDIEIPDDGLFGERDLKQQRDDLLAALKELVGHVDTQYENKKMIHAGCDQVEHARTTIAKAEGKQ